MKKSSNPLDKRFKIAHREALIGIILVLINFIWWYGFAYGLGSAKVEQYSYIYGLPAWFFYSCILGFIVMVILVIFSVRVLFKDVPFEVEEGENQ
ncbi:YhdT family protein [Bacillus sp. ISL-40]|uniref:YhdT family protein n=1 Tax=unclassified Bacillus (in: firmicutes) TaxID=185979 RepID=UPI001BECC443|nr:MULTISPECIES: YhdT family protein [unclassified Bacillus (in: firmicutes)]MBT2698150.1 YhdT family protein [Bacillus sp. ISL-40]MBT2742028.1 YhdT family protein [Bacillus sp. ISL-77]